MNYLQLFRSTEKFSDNDIVAYLDARLKTKTFTASYPADPADDWFCSCGDYPEIQGLPSLSTDDLKQPEYKKAIEALLMSLAEKDVPCVNLCLFGRAGGAEEDEVIDSFCSGLTYEVSDYNVYITLDAVSRNELKVRCEGTKVMIIG